MAPKMLSPDNHDRRLAEQVHEFMASAKPAGVIAALLGMAERPDATGQLSRISVPTLVIAGEDDALIPPAESRTLAQAIPGSQLNAVLHAGHLVAFEQPAEFNHVLQEWLNRAGFAFSGRAL